MNETLEKIKRLLETAEKFQKSYFWQSPSTAASRRSMERQNSIDEFCWDEGGHHYTAEFKVECSCRNVYASGTYTKDGVKTTLTAVRNSYKRMQEAVK